MPSVFPETTSGGLAVRDGAGNPANPPNTQNAYPPKPAFVSTCPITALPSDCTARILPAQINAIVSELTALAECWDANGPWDCASLQNLCSAFTQWALVNIAGVIVSDTPPVGAKDNQLWWESDTGVLFINYNDGNSTQWVMATPAVTVTMDKVSIVGAGTVIDPHAVGLVDCGQY